MWARGFVRLVTMLGQPGPWCRLLIGCPDVRGELVEDPLEAGELCGGDALAQPLVELYCGVTQSQEGGLPGARQLDEMDAAIVLIAAAGEQAVFLHRVEVVGERRLADSDGLRELTLISGRADLEVEQHQPCRRRSARLAECIVEGAADQASRAGEVKADRRAGWSHSQRIAGLIDL